MSCDAQNFALCVGRAPAVPWRSAAISSFSQGQAFQRRLPAACGSPTAAVVITGPLTSVKEQAAGVYAAALAGRGFAALAFDHRTFGQSEGMPRQLEDPPGKVADISAAVSELQAAERLAGRPVVALGVCAGSGYMARAVADDPRIRAFARGGRGVSRRGRARPGGGGMRARCLASPSEHRDCRDDPRRGGGRRRRRDAAAGKHSITTARPAAP